MLGRPSDRSLNMRASRTRKDFLLVRSWAVSEWVIAMVSEVAAVLPLSMGFLPMVA